MGANSNIGDDQGQLFGPNWSRKLWKAFIIVSLFACCWVPAEAANPTFDNISGSTILTVGEDAALNDVLKTIAVSDTDGHTPISLAVSGTTDFGFDGSSNDLEVKDTLDYETTPTYSVTIVATDSNSESASVVITINVVDKNDNDPTLTLTTVDVTLNEELAAGTAVPFVISASDLDTNDGTTLAFSLSGADASIFNINPSNGDVTLNSKVDIDPDNANKVYKPIVTVSDSSRIATATLTLTLLDINDNKPSCDPSIEYKTVTEETSGSTVYTLTCTDADSSYQNNDVLAYSLTSPHFSVNAASGVVTVSSAVDYESSQSETLRITVADTPASGALDTTATIVVSIGPTNDNDPVWGTFVPAPTASTFTQDEDIGIGTSLFRMVATDADVDTGSTITFSIVSVTDGTNPVTGLFNVDPSTGEVTNLAALDRDGGISQYTLNIQATDGGSGTHIITDTVFLALNDVNDIAPVFQSTPLALVTIAENSAKTGSVVTTVSASDGDVTAAAFSYAVEAIVEGGTSVGDWAFSGTTAGQLEFAKNINLDTGDAAVHVLRLIVKDGGATELTGTTSLTLSISPDNEYTPTISSQPAGTVSIDENEPVGTSVAQITGADSDTGDEGVLAYSITGGNTGTAFSIGASTGILSTQTVLDKETLDNYNLEITVKDSAASPKSVTTTVSIAVADVNDHQPSCTALFISISPPENTAVNAALTTLACSDTDTGDSLTYTVRTPHNTQFGFTTPDDELKLLTALNYDSATQTYLVYIDVSDGTNTQVVTVSVNVGPVNDDTPAFATNPTETVTENTVSNPITTYTAVDTDFSPHDIVNYEITAVTNSGAAFFAIDSSSAELSLRQGLDYETLPTGDKTYEITVVATDGGNLKGTGTVTVSVDDANDNAPACTQASFTVDVNELQSGPHNVLTLGCTDAEDGTSLSYSLTQTPGSHFTVASDVVTLTAGTLSYETATQHTLTITVTDSGSPTAQSTTVLVYVNVVNQNDGGPVFGALTAKSIDENLGVGQSVIDITAVDPDGSDVAFGDIQYSILSGDGSNQFAIDASSGEITVRKALDFETTSSYDLVIQAIERGGTNSASATQTINLNDVNDEEPSCPSYAFTETVNEDENVDYVVKALGCSDGDAGTTLTYTITSGDTSLFKVESGSLKLKAQLDFETATSHALTIQVSDGVAGHNKDITGTVTVGSVDEGPPVFTQSVYNVDVSESATTGHLVVTVAANDPDSGSDANGEVTFTFVSTYSDFVLDQSSGAINLAQSLDRETDGTPTLLVKAADATGITTATVSVTVLDINDNTPQFLANPYTGSLSEGDATGTTVVTVLATDDDATGNNYGVVAYALTGSSDFAVNPSTGVITNTAVLSADSGTETVTLTVTATDSGGGAGALTGTTTVVVTVNTVNGNDPVFTQVTTNVNIAENDFSVGDTIASVTATDSDTGADGDVTCTFVSAQSKFGLDQVGDVCSLRLIQALDFDSGDTTFSVEIKATDGGVPARSATGTVAINVDDANDNSPLCTSVVNVNKDEDQTNIATLSCTDVDAGTTLAYSIVSTTPSSTSPAVSSTGVVTATLDYETDTSYVILIKVEDDGVPQKSTTVTLNLVVNDLNDNDPSLTGPFTFTVLETAGAGSTVYYTATASSNDGPTDTLTFSLSDTTFFDITSGTGEITLKTQAPDRETDGATVTTDLCVSDSANPTVRSACQTITISVTDENDVTPVFNPASYTGSVAEDATLTTALATPVTATDGDVSAGFNSVTYSISSGNTGTAFSINSASGVVSVAAALNFATTPAYTLVIQATDGTNSATANYNIQVISANQNDPVWSQANEIVSVDENVSTGTAVPYTATASDSDSEQNGDLTYSIGAGPFSINPSTGAISVAGSLDRETDTSHTVTIEAIDGGDTPRTGTLTLTINVNDVNDETPSCTKTLYTASLLETATAGDTVVTLACTDDDDDPAGLNNDLTYSIVSGDTSVFTVDTAGVIKVETGATFDLLLDTEYELIVDVVDKSTATKLTFTATVSVTMVDVNDQTPFFLSLPSADAPENTAVGSTISVVVALDDDVGANAEIVYQIDSGNVGDTFYIDPVTGDVTVLKALDYDTDPKSYELVISATDKGVPALSVTGTVTISLEDVSDEPITCDSNLYSAETPENAQDTFLDVAVVCTKPDENAGLVQYAIVEGNEDGHFFIDDVLGELYTTAGASLNFETTTSYTLIVTASEGGQSTNLTIKVTVTDVNEFSPAFTPAGPYSTNLDENVSIGHTVTTVSASDGDSADPVKVFSITNGNSEGKFQLDSSSGVLAVQAALDFETTQSYSLTLTVSDSGGSSGNVVINIAVDDVNDNAPVCQDAAVVRDVDEGVTTGSIYTPTCSDPDTVATPTLAYSISSGAHASISINPSTGELSLVSALDYETATSHLVVIEVSDQDTPTARTTTIDVTIAVNPVNEDPPAFTPSSSYGPVSVDENESIGTSVAQVIASDPDQGDDHGSVRFAIVGGDLAQQFNVDTISGVISTVKALDRETTASYNLLIRATDETAGDAGQRSVTATVSIDVADVNDLDPTFNPAVYTVDVLETATAGPAVVLKTLTVTDGDDGANAATTLTITSGNDEAKFSISGTNLILSAGLDYETTTSYDLVITATDGGTPPRSGVARVTVNVQPDNEVAPLMSSASASAEISEETAVGTLVYDANATDTDTGGSDGTITYSITSGVTGNDFFIDAFSGQLFVGSQLDFDVSPTSYAIVISAEDGTGLTDASTSTVSLTVTLLDENDHVPVFSTSLFTFSLEEGVITGTSVGTVVVTDGDSGVNGDVSLAITGGTGSAYLTINAATGEVTTTAAIDYEVLPILYLSLSATDGGTPPLSSVGLVKVEVTNMNDNDPVITPSELAVTITEASVIGTLVTTFAGTDDDTAIDAFGLVTASSFFQVDSATGVVTTSALLDRETTASYTLEIRVVDLPTSGDPGTIRSATATLTVIISDENDNDPTITGSYSPNIPEDSSLNTLVFTVAASDPDDGANGQLTYAITAGNTGSAFTIDSTGRVLVAAALDRETTASYTLTIVVSDQGTPPRSDQIDVTVTIDDVNDNDPIEAQSAYTFTVDENSAVDTAVGTVVATDADAGANALLVYTLDAFSVGDAAHFKIDSATGEISVAQASLDRETTPTYVASVKVTDSGVTVIRTTYTAVTINIGDVNDNDPIMSQDSYSASVSESADTSTIILTVVATDADAGVNADITYTIDTALLDGPTANTFFQVGANSGRVKPKTTLDYETHQSFRFIVQAADGGAPTRTDTATVTVSLIDANDNRPVFSPTFYNTEVAYDGTCASTIATVSATDADSGSNAAISYSLQTTTFNYLFDVDATWGALTMKSLATANIKYSLEIQATDAGSPSVLSAASPAKVRVDAFIPNDHVITIRLGISRVDFVAQQATFLANLQLVIRNTHPTALLRLWCLAEYSGTAVSPPTGRRRLLADQPVDVHTFVVQDDSTESEANLGNDKTLLTQDEYLALVADGGDPNTALQGSDWDYFQISAISEYTQSTEGWFDTLHGKVITGVACFLGLVLLVLFIYMAAEACCGNGFRRRPQKRKGSPKTSKIEPRAELDSLPRSRASTAQSNTRPLKPFWDNNWAGVSLTDALAEEDVAPVRASSNPPPYTQDEETSIRRSPTLVSERASSNTPRTPRSVFFNEAADGNSGVGNKEFDGKAYDHATGKMYEYNTKTNERRWLKST